MRSSHGAGLSSRPLQKEDEEATMPMPGMPVTAPAGTPGDEKEQTVEELRAATVPCGTPSN